MERNKIILLLIILLSTACNHIPTSYSISGECSKLNGKMVYISKVSEKQLIDIDSALIENNKFIIKGIQDAPAVYYIRVGDDHNLHTPFVLENGNLILDYNTTLTVSGTFLNDVLQKYLQYKKNIDYSLLKVEERYMKSLKDSTINPSLENLLSLRYDSLTDVRKKEIKKMILNNSDNVVGAFILGRNCNIFTNNELSSILDKVELIFKNEADIKTLQSRLKNQSKVSVGRYFEDLVLKYPNGKKGNLSDCVGKGKFLIVNFWASWCPACTRLFPELKQLYYENKYKGVDIVGISLDRDSLSWRTSISQNELPWEQFSDPKGWDSETVEKYGIYRIPSFMIFTPDGTIAARDLSIINLKEKLTELIQ